MKTRHYPNGQVKFIDSLDRDGQSRNFTYFRADGTLEGKLPIQNAHIQGLVKWYDTRGKLKSTEVWVKGHKQGMVMDYYPNGAIKCEKIMHNSTIVDTSHFYYPTGEEQQALVRSATGRLIDFAAWHPNGLIDTRYTRALFLSDRDTVRPGQNYTFEIRLGNRHSNEVTVCLKPVPAGLDSTTGTFAPTRYIIRHPTPGTHVICGQIKEEWARKGSDTIWTNYYDIEHTFRVANKSSHSIAP